MVTEEEVDKEELSINKNEADITSDDLLILGAKDGTLNMGLEDDQYIRINTGLDKPDNLPEIPGAELDDVNKEIWRRR